MTEDFKPNSDRARQNGERRAQKVISGKTTRHTQSELGRVLSSFLPADIRSISDDIRKGITDDFVPSIRHAIYECIVSGIRVIFGESGGSTRGYGGYYSQSSYRRQYDQTGRASESQGPKYSRPQQTPGMRCQNVVFEDRGDAEVVLYNMRGILSEYDVVSVADFLILSGEKNTYVDDKFGWFDLSDARVERVHDGYIVNLPKAVDIRG